MQRIDLTDFSGGLSEQYAVDSFTNRQWAKLKGFVIDSETSIRSQWPAQSIGQINGGFLSVSGFNGSTKTYLIAIGNDGFIYHTEAPSNTANYSTTNAITWTKFNEIPASTDYRFICEMLYPVPNVGEVNALLINSINENLDNYAIYENDITGNLTVKTWYKHYPTDQLALSYPLESTPTFDTDKHVISPNIETYVKTSDAYTIQSIEAGYTGTFGTTDLIIWRKYNLDRAHTFSAGDNINVNPFIISESLLKSTFFDMYTTADQEKLGFNATFPENKPNYYADRFKYSSFVNINTTTGTPEIGDSIYATTSTSVSFITGKLIWNGTTNKYDTVRKYSGGPSGTYATAIPLSFQTTQAPYSLNIYSNYLPLNTSTTGAVTSTYNGSARISDTYPSSYIKLPQFNYEVLVNDSEDKTISIFRFNTGDETYSLITDVLPKDTYVFDGTISNLVLKIKTGQSGNIKGRLGFKKDTSTYPNARQQAMPRATLGTMWRNRLVLGNIEKRIDGTKSWTYANNIQIAPYAFWYSGIIPDTFYEQAILYAGSGESQLLGLHVIDDTLITISSPATDTDGIRSFRGSLDYLALQSGQNTMSINILRGGVGPTRNANSTVPRKSSCLWPEAGIVVFLDHLGGIWYTNGSEVDRLDRFGLKTPEVTTVNDQIEAVGRYLFVYRNNRLLCLNMLAGSKGNYATAAWTEIKLPDGKTISSLQRINANLYFIMDGKIYRFSMSRNNDSDSERACFNGVQEKLTVATPTVGDSDQQQKVNWMRFAFRTKGNTNTSKIYDMKIIAGPSLDGTKPSYTKTLNRILDSRDEAIIPAGIGVSTEASGEITFYGDVNLESATFYTSGGRMSRPDGGSDA